MSVLSVRGVGKRFGAVVALADVSIDVAEGSRTAVVGPSGSGKTTLLRLIAGFEAPDIGAIVLDGETIADARAGVPAHRRSVGLVMQEGVLFPHLSVLDNVRFGIRREAGSEARALELMRLVELDPAMAKRQPHQLSGGQQQRVALARALARRPRVMLLDEPFAALDTGLRESLRQTTAKLLGDAGIATVLVTHDRDEAMIFADQLVVLRDGRLQAGKPRDLYLAPADLETAAFLGPVIVLDAEVENGTARCSLGVVPLADPGRATGTVRILLRPEQLAVLPAGEDARWRLTRIQFAGSTAHVTLEGIAEPQRLTFETPAGRLPAEGSLVSVAVLGGAHVLD